MYRSSHVGGRVDDHREIQLLLIAAQPQHRGQGF